jgi:uncharacterized protein YfaT (DUF1175 family)
MIRGAIGGGAALAAVLGAAGWWTTRPPEHHPATPRPPAAGPALTDSASDGTPDFARLTDPSDRRAFTGWFAFLAEVQFFRPASALPEEVADCAGLVRFAYREALRKHTGAWAAQLQLDDVPPLGSISKYHYPFTPLGAALFRVREGLFAAADLRNGAFAEFADAKTLMRYNTHLVTRDVQAARPGDLLFFYQPGQRFPYHVMIYLGPSRVQPGTGPFVIYHTGPGSQSPGEVRRPSVEELFAHPNPQWRPHEGNQHFLGVFRWNILNG